MTPSVSIVYSNCDGIDVVRVSVMEWKGLLRVYHVANINFEIVFRCAFHLT
jgi:hypothetical protein